MDDLKGEQPLSNQKNCRENTMLVCFEIKTSIKTDAEVTEGRGLQSIPWYSSAK